MNEPDDSDGFLGRHPAFDHEESGDDGSAARNSRVTMNQYDAYGGN
jgi:hypothetical protein